MKLLKLALLLGMMMPAAFAEGFDCLCDCRWDRSGTVSQVTRPSPDEDHTTCSNEYIGTQCGDGAGEIIGCVQKKNIESGRLEDMGLANDFSEL